MEIRNQLLATISLIPLEMSDKGHSHLSTLSTIVEATEAGGLEESESGPSLPLCVSSLSNLRSACTMAQHGKLVLSVCYNIVYRSALHSHYSAMSPATLLGLRLRSQLRSQLRSPCTLKIGNFQHIHVVICLHTAIRARSSVLSRFQYF